MQGFLGIPYGTGVSPTRTHGLTGFCQGEAGWSSRGTNRSVSPTDPDSSLSVSIPEPSPLRVLLGTSLTIPCYFIDPMHPVTTAPATAPLTPRIKWSRISKEKEMVLLVATDGQVRVSSAYQDKVSLPNYPAIPSDATLEIQNLRSNDSGIYRCEVMHGIEDSEATVEVVVKGESPPLPLLRDPDSPAKRTKHVLPVQTQTGWLSNPSSSPRPFAPQSTGLGGESLLPGYRLMEAVLCRNPAIPWAVGAYPLYRQAN